MNNKKVTRSAVFASFTALLLCASMLIATTFAWFTDSVTSSGNIIKSGTLDIEMYWADGTKAVPTDDTGWTDASAGAIFNYDLWEPGYTEVRHIKIKNNGTLALKYQLRVVATGTASDLTDVIDVYFTDPAAQVADRTALTDANKLDTLTAILAGMPGNTAGQLTAGQEATVTLALKMQEEAGNEYQNKSVGSDFAVQLLATQLTAETDSFDDQYDVAAPMDYVLVSDAAELNAALDNQEAAIMLTEDIVLSEPVTVGNAVNLNLNNKTLTTVGLNFAADVTIENGTIKSGGNTNMTPHLKASAGELTMNNVTVDVDHHLNANVYWTEATGMEVMNATAVLNNCDIQISNGTKAQWVYSYGLSLNNANVTMNGGSITAECVDGTAANGPTNPNAISTMGACTATLNNVQVTAMYYGTTVNGHLTLNTTDKNVTDADIVDNRGGSHTLNHIG